MTEQNKAEPLDAEWRSIGSGRQPSNGEPQGNQGNRAAGAIVALAPSARGHVLSPEQTNKKARASKYSLRRRNTPTNELSHPPGWRSGAPGGCTTLTDHVKGEIAELPFGRIP